MSGRRHKPFLRSRGSPSTVAHEGAGAFRPYQTVRSPGIVRIRPAAVAASLQVQRDLAGGEVRVRIGINAGEPIAEEDDLFGASVQLAARVTDRAEPGQVLVSDVVRQLCTGKTFEFSPVGEATLKRFAEPVALFEVRAG